MLRKILSLFLTYYLLVNVFALTEDKKEEKSIAKRGIFHLNVRGLPKVPSSKVHHFIPKIQTNHKHFISIFPTIPYHHGGATVTSFNANYPRFSSFPKEVFPNYNNVFSHVQDLKPIVPIAFPYAPPPKHGIIYSKPQFVPVSSNPYFVPITIPPQLPSATLPINSGIKKLSKNTKKLKY